MYLSRVDLLPCTHLNFLKKSPQNLHAAVAEAFDGTQKRWRIDGDVLWVISEKEASSPQSLPGRFQARDVTNVFTKVPVGTRVAFRLKAVPMKSVRRSPEEDTRPRPCYTEESQLSWLQDRQHRLGFDLETFKIVDAGKEDFLHDGESQKITWVTYEGTGTITDPEVLSTALLEGIGKRGAWGFGLLTIAKA